LKRWQYTGTCNDILVSAIAASRSYPKAITPLVKRWQYTGTGNNILVSAIAAIRSYPKAITSFEEVATIRGVGAKMAEKIRELLAYGKITKVGNFNAYPEVRYFSCWFFVMHCVSQG
jgi:hypothetical protein